MQPVLESVFKQKLSHKQFGLGVFAPDPAHVATPYLGFVNVGHIRICGVRIANLHQREALINLEDVLLAQAKNYVVAYDFVRGLLINFGAISLQYKLIFNPKYQTPPTPQTSSPS